MTKTLFHLKYSFKLELGCIFEIIQGPPNKKKVIFFFRKRTALAVTNSYENVSKFFMEGEPDEL